jgi:hypothetical protein
MQFILVIVASAGMVYPSIAVDHIGHLSRAGCETVAAQLEGKPNIKAVYCITSDQTYTNDEAEEAAQ